MKKKKLEFVGKETKLAKDQKIVCYFCKDEINFCSIKQFVDGGKTAICHLCGVDSVIVVPSTFSQKELKKLHNEMFGHPKKF